MNTFRWFITVIVVLLSITVEGKTISQGIFEKSDLTRAGKLVAENYYAEEPDRPMMARAMAGPVPATTNLAGLGSEENAIAYSVANSRDIAITVQQRTPNGVVRKSLGTSMGGLNTKSQIDDFFRQKAKVVTGQVMTNSVDKGGIFEMFAFTTKRNTKLGIVIYLQISVEFRLDQLSDGSYQAPDFSSLELGLPSTIMFEIQGLEWVRMELYSNPIAPGERPYDETDSRIDPSHNSMEFAVDLDFIQIRTDLVISGTNGPTQIKITTGTQEGDNFAFRVFGPMGNQIAETPFAIKDFTVQDGKVSFQVTGGDPGRMFVIQCAPTPSGPWSDVTEPNAVRRYGASTSYVGDIHHPTCLYQIKAVNMYPITRL